MRQAIRALGWATYIFMIILLFFTVTAVYSALQIKPGFGEPYINTLNGTVTVSLPLSLANGGFYDISNLNLTTLINDNGGLPVSGSSTFVPLIPRGGNVSVTHRMSISISQMTAENLSNLLFNDSDFNVGISLKLDYANAVPLKISTNLTMPWGAPLSNLTIGTVSVSRYNATHFRAIVPVSFENHAFFSLDGTMRLEVVDNTNRLLVSETTFLEPSVPPESGYSFPFEVFIPDPTSLFGARLYFETSIFSYRTGVIPLVRG